MSDLIPTEPPRRDAIGIRLIVLYKLVKAAIQLVCAPILFALRGTTLVHLHLLALRLQDHAVTASSTWLAEWLLATTRRLITVTAVALLLDGLLSLVEGWALHRRRWWAEWLIVIASGTPLPIEIFELAHHPRAGRAALLAFNSVIVLYLLRRRLALRKSANAAP